MQVFYRDNPTGRGDLGREFVQPIEPDARDLVVGAAHLVFRLEPVLPIFGASCQFFVQTEDVG